jgi:hypothetical protein
MVLVVLHTSASDEVIRAVTIAEDELQRHEAHFMLSSFG